VLGSRFKVSCFRLLGLSLRVKFKVALKVLGF
jgi:hypothetical protein